MHSGHRPFRVQLAIVDRKDQLEIRARREDGAGFHVASTHADIDQIPKDRCAVRFWMQLTRNPAFHAGIEPAVLARWLLPRLSHPAETWLARRLAKESLQRKLQIRPA